MRHSRFACTASAVGMFLVAGAPAHAIDADPIRFGAIEVIPDLNTKVTPTGSTWLANGEEESSELLVFKPKVTALAAHENKEFFSTLEIQNGNYSAPGVGNYIDWKFESGARVELDPRNHLAVRNEFFHTHEGAGAMQSEAPAAADRFTTSTFDTSYEYATATGRARFALNAGTFAKDYLVATAGRSDHEENRWGSSFTFRVLPGADMLLQYRAADFDYRDDAFRPRNLADARPRNETFTYVGATWEVPANIAGKLRIASGFKETVTASGFALADTSSWETRLRWEPQADSIVTLNADRIMRERSGVDTQPDTSKLRYNWEYRFAHQLKATVGGEYSRDSWLDSNREDQGMDLKLRMDYAWSGWLDMFVAVGHDERRSPQNSFNFSQQTIMLGIAASLERLLGK